MPVRADTPRSLLLFSGSNDRAVHAIARAAHQCGVRYQVVAWGEQDRICRGLHRSAICAVRRDSQLDVDRLRDWVGKARLAAPDDTFVLVPTSEFLNGFLLGLQAEECAALGVSVPLVDRDTYDRLTNKASATGLFSSSGLRTPAALEGFSADLLPMVAKPRNNLGRSGRTLYPRLLQTPGELDAFRREEMEDEFFPQEFLHGTSQYLLAYVARNGMTFLSSQTNLAQQPQGKSIVLARTDDFFRSEAAERTIALLRDQGFFGFAMVEFISDAKGPCFIEVNPRPWGPLQLCVDHDCGIVEAFLGEAIHGDPQRFRDVWSRKARSARYLWTGGLLQSLAGPGQVRWAERSRLKRFFDITRSLDSDVYLRRDSWRVFIDEARSA